MTSSTRPTILRGDAAQRAQGAFDSPAIATFDPAMSRHVRNPAEAAEAARQVGFDKGYRDGLDAARRDIEAATEEANARVRRVLGALRLAVDELDGREATALTSVEDEIVAAAFEIARNVIGRELQVATDPGADAIARTLHLLPERGDVTVRLNPEDAISLNTPELSTSARRVEIIADAAVEPGGCIVDAASTRIDAQLSSALRKVAEALFGDHAARTIDSAVAGSSPTDSRMTAEEAPLP